MYCLLTANPSHLKQRETITKKILLYESKWDTISQGLRKICIPSHCGTRLGNSPSKNPLFWMRFHSFFYSFLFNTWVSPKQNKKLHENFVICIIAFNKARETLFTSYTITSYIAKGKGLSFHLTSFIYKWSIQSNHIVCKLSSAWRGLSCYRKLFTLHHHHTCSKMIQWPCHCAISFHRLQKKPRWIAGVGYLRPINHIPKVL